MFKLQIQLNLFDVEHFPACFNSHATTIIHSLFRKNFTKSSNIYKRYGQSSYDQHHCTTDHIHTCIKEENDNNVRWIYIGEIKEGTNDIPHGTGIQVYKDGNTQKFDNKDSCRYVN